MALSIPLITEYSGKGLDKFRKELAQTETATQKAGLVFKKAMVPATAAIGALAVALADATKAAIEDAASANLLATNLRRTTGATDAVIAATEDWIATQGQLLGVADDDLRPALSRLARVTGDVTKAQKIVAQAMDISAATGKPLETVVQGLERAYSGNMTSLQRLLPEYRSMIKEGASFEDVMARIATVTGGAATDAANTAQGQFKRLSLAFNETKESIGAALLPVVEAVLPYLQQFAMWAQNNPGAFLAIAGAIGAVAAAIVAVNVAMALNPFALIAGGIVALGAALVVAYNRFEGFRNIVNAIFDGLKAGVALAIDNFMMLLNVWKNVFNGLARIWNNTLGKLDISIPDIPGLPGRGKSFGIPNIPYLAEGGIVTRPSLAMIAEAGEPEAVIPLSKLSGMLGGGGGGVTINVSGGDPNAVVDALRRYMVQNGPIPITVQ
jgi:hypothetical protein